MTTITRHRERAPRQAVQAAGATLALETAAALARRERTVAAAVRSAWDVLAADADSGHAFAAWRNSLGHAGPVEDLFPAVCLASATPAAVAASLYRAAAQIAGRAAA